MKLQIIFATGNENKIREIREIITDPEIHVVSMKQAGIAADPEENGTTFEENAQIKAQAVFDILQQSPQLLHQDALQYALPQVSRVPLAVMSDDSGLVIDALDGAPGIYSARFMGHETSYTLKMQHILEMMKDVPEEKRSARFVAAVSAAVLLPDASVRHFTVRGTMEGRIGHAIAGEHGFGYDPFFFLPDLGKTSAELTDDEKNAVSHRGKAIRAMLEQLRPELG